MIPLVSSWWLFLNHNAGWGANSMSLTELRQSSDFQKGGWSLEAGYSRGRELCAERAPEIHHKDHLEFWLNAKSNMCLEKTLQGQAKQALGSSKLNNSQN